MTITQTIEPELPTRAQAGKGNIPGSAYDGADKLNRLGAWAAPMRSADADLLRDKGVLDARARDMTRNDAYVAGGARLRKDNIVGATYMLNAAPNSLMLFGKEDAVWEAEAQLQIETAWQLWAESPMNWVDAQRVNNFTDLVRLGVGSHTIHGEVLASAEWMKNDGRPFRSAIQMIDVDRLSNPDMQMDSPKLRGGVERDTYGAPVAYHIRTSHPSDVGNTPGLYTRTWTRVPAIKARWGRRLILHVYEQLRPDQSRGVSALATALTEMRMTKHFRAVTLQAAVVAATYAASIESDLPPTEAYAAMGAASAPEGDDSPMMKVVKEYLNAIAEYTQAGGHAHMDGVKIPVFAPGTHMKVQSPGVGPIGSDFEASLLRYVAAALGVSYEQLSLDYSHSNYSSSRAAVGETIKAMATIKRQVADSIANFVYRLWLEEVIATDAIPALDRPNAPSWYEGLNAEAYSQASWVGTGQGQIDEMKETQAAGQRLKLGLSTKEDEIKRISGKDWRQVSKQIKREIENDKALGVPCVYTAEADAAEAAAEVAAIQKSEADDEQQKRDDEKPGKSKSESKE